MNDEKNTEKRREKGSKEQSNIDTEERKVKTNLKKAYTEKERKQKTIKEKIKSK